MWAWVVMDTAERWKSRVGLANVKLCKLEQEGSCSYRVVDGKVCNNDE